MGGVGAGLTTDLYQGGNNMQNVLTMEQLESITSQIEAHKVALVARDESRDIFEQAKERFIIDNQESWKETGEYYRSLRMKQGLTQENIAKAIGVSASKISKFERGQCITNSKLLEKACHMFLMIHEVNNMLSAKSDSKATKNIEVEATKEPVYINLINQLGIKH